MTAGFSLVVQGCTFQGLDGVALFVATPAQVTVTESTFLENGHGVELTGGAAAMIARSTFTGHTDVAIRLVGTNGPITTADIAASTFSRSFFGILITSAGASDAVRASVSNSQIVQHTQVGVLVNATGAAPATLSAINNIVSHNGVGLLAIGATARLWASGNTVSNNVTGLSQGTLATFESAGNNAVRNNETDKLGTITKIVTE